MTSVDLFAILHEKWRTILVGSLLVAFGTLLWQLRQPNIYRTTAVITPHVDENKKDFSLGAFASYGFIVGGPSKVEDLETFFKSKDLTARVFRNNKLWEIVFPNRYDLQTGALRRSWLDRVIDSKSGARAPGDWDAIRVAKDRLQVNVSRRTNTVSLSFDSPSAPGSAIIVSRYLEEGKDRLQEEALHRANMNKRFIEEQISKTVDPLVRDRLYVLYGQEVEQEMQARNREHFGFRIIDQPRAPDRKYKPHRAFATIMAFLLSAFAGCAFFIMNGTPKDLTGKDSTK